MKKPTQDQQQVIDTWGQGLAVNAGAGTGKSTTLVQKCKALLQKNPEARFAAVSFTEKSASELKTKLLKEGISLGSRHWVNTIHGLCGAIVREFARESGFDGEERLLSETESRLLWQRALEPLWFDGVEGEIRLALEHLLGREKRSELEKLLDRVRGLSGLGLIEKMSENLDRGVQALHVLGSWALERYDRSKRRQGAIDFDDLEKGALRALQFDSVASTYHQRFELVLVDEFQDTNPVQARILDRLVRPGSSNLVVVGDPKQSIYRFRDADVTIFKELCETLPKKVLLKTNFRSDARLISAINQICEPLFMASGMEYEALEPGLENLGQKSPLIRIPIQEPSDLARWIGQEVQNGIHLGEMVILLKRLKGREEWIKGLSKAGVPLALASGFFYSDPRVVELVSFLKWWFEPHQRHSAAIFLRAPWVGLTDRELDRWLSLDSKTTDLKKLFISSAHPLAKSLSELVDRTVTPGDCLLKLLVTERHEAEIGMSVLQLWHRCEEWSTQGMSALDIVRELTRKVELKERESEISPPTTRGQLRIMTIHASKGLEFEHVILADLKKSYQRARAAPLLYWDRSEGVFLAKRDLEGDRVEDDEEERVWKERESLKELDESKRLFYVALTRAQKRIVLVDEGWEGEKSETEAGIVVEPPTKSKKPKKEIGLYEKEHWRRWLLDAGVAIDDEIPPAVYSQEVFKRDLNWIQKSPQLVHPTIPTKPRLSVTELNDLSRCSLRYEKLFIRPEFDPLIYLESSDLEEEKIWLPPGVDQREIGKEVHRALELGDLTILKALEEKVTQARFESQHVIDWAQATPWMKFQAWPEFAFEVADTQGQVVVGAMDRLVRDDQGRYHILDFKVTAKEKSAESLIETYQTQLMIYAWAVGQMQPLAQNRISARLVHFTKSKTQEIEVVLPEYDKLNQRVESWTRAASLIIAGQSGVPQKSEACHQCDYRTKCPLF